MQGRRLALALAKPLEVEAAQGRMTWTAWQKSHPRHRCHRQQTFSCAEHA
jgi:hypothetical protein